LEHEKTDHTSGKGWALAGFLTGVMVSILANIARVYVRPEHAPATWKPQPGAIGAAAFWPIALLIAIEVISRVQWPRGIVWLVLRYGGLTTVAAIAAIISYRHMSGLLTAYGESEIGAKLGPLAVDGLMVVSSGALLAIADNVRSAARAGEAVRLARPPMVEASPEAPAPTSETEPRREAARELAALDVGSAGDVPTTAPERPSALVPEGGAATGHPRAGDRPYGPPGGPGGAGGGRWPKRGQALGGPRAARGGGDRAGCPARPGRAPAQQAGPERRQRGL
jgi:hypothetical protein